MVVQLFELAQRRRNVSVLALSSRFDGLVNHP